MKRTLVVEEQSRPEDIQVVRQGLDEFNTAFGGAINYRGLAIFLRDEKDQVFGGLIGGTYWNYLYVDVL